MEGNKPWMQVQGPNPKQTEEMLRQMVQQPPPQEQSWQKAPPQPVLSPNNAQNPQNPQINPQNQGFYPQNAAPQGGFQGQYANNSPLVSAPGPYPYQQSSQPQMRPPPQMPPGQRPPGVPGSQYPPSQAPPKKTEVSATKKKAVLFWTMVGIVVVSAIGLIVSVAMYFSRYG